MGQMLFIKAIAVVSVTLTTVDAALKTVVDSPIEMIATAHPSATEAGQKILEKGGTAVDAMIAIQTVLGLVEPQSSGMGGGAFVVYYDSETQRITTYDGREKAPLQATENRFMLDGEPLSFFDAWQCGLSVGVPGVPKLMEVMHERYGKLPWNDLFVDATDLATNGFEVTSRTQQGIELLGFLNPPNQSACVEGDDPLFLRDPVMFDYFVNSTTCTSKAAGSLLTNLEYADLMQQIALDGSKVFYEGEIAQEIVDKVGSDRNPTGDATITLDDLSNYEVIEREPVCQSYKGYKLCGMGPPSSGGLAVGQIFGILNNFNMSTTREEIQSPEIVHLFTQAMRLAFADRNLFVADSDFVTFPVEGMMDMKYLAERSTLIDPNRDMGLATPGNPEGIFDPDMTSQTKDFEGGTSHISIVDQYGNALSMTTTIESFFGAGLMVHGMLLNNQLTDFSFLPTSDDGDSIANRPQGGKRPRSSMSPTIALDDKNQVAFLTGSPGGSRIIGYTAQSLLSMIDFDLNPQEAANLPHFQNRNGDTELEPPKPDVTSDYNLTALLEALQNMSHTVVETGGESSGLGIIAVKDGMYLGGVDPRRDGTASGRQENGSTTSLPSTEDASLAANRAVQVTYGVGLAIFAMILYLI